jgi:protein lifeguard
MKKIRSFFFMLVLFQLGIIIFLAFVPLHPILKFALFTLFAVLIGITTKVALQKVPHEVIQTAILGTIAIFVTFAIVGAVLAGLGIDIGFIGVALFALIIVSVVYLFMKQSSVINKVLAIFSLLLFSVYIVYDTNIILQREYQGDFITASLDYFLDVLNIFMNLIRFSQN